MIRILCFMFCISLLIGCQTNETANSNSTRDHALWVLTDDNALFAMSKMTGRFFVEQTRNCMNIVVDTAAKQGLSEAMTAAVVKLGRKDVFPKCMRSKGFDLANVSAEIVTHLPNGKADGFYVGVIDKLASIGALDGVNSWPDLLANGDLDALKSYLETYQTTIYMQAAKVRYEVLKP